MTGSPGSAFNIQSSTFSVQRSRFHSEHRHPHQVLIREIRAIRGQIPFELSHGQIRFQMPAGRLPTNRKSSQQTTKRPKNTKGDKV